MAEPDAVDEMLHRELEKSLDAVSRDICKESLAPNSLVSVQAKAEIIKLQLKTELNELCTKCTNGLQAILQTLKSEIPPADGDLSYEALKGSLDAGFSKIGAFDDLMSRANEACKGTTWSALLGLDEKTLSTLYTGAKSLLNKNKYKEAEDAFTFLASLDGWQSCFWLGLGHAQFHSNNYTGAIDAYKNASVCEPDSLWLHIYIANCYEPLQDFPNALEHIQEALRLLVEASENRELEDELQERLLFLKNRSTST